MRKVLSGIIGLLIVLASLKAVEVGHCLARLEAQDDTIKRLEQRIQQANRNTAKQIAKVRPQAPCDLTGYVFKPIN